MKRRTALTACGVAAVVAAAPSAGALVLRWRGRSWSYRQRAAYGQRVIVGWEYREYPMRLHLPLLIPRYWRSEDDYQAEISRR